jgi:hypothetical protein
MISVKSKVLKVHKGEKAKRFFLKDCKDFIDSEAYFKPSFLSSALWAFGSFFSK